MTFKKIVLVGVLLTLAVPGAALAQKRTLTANDVYNIKDVRDPQRSPDGKWVAYVVSRAIQDGDKNDSDIWMASWDGTQEIQLTSSPDSESQPRWSPDNKYLSFVSSRQGAKGGQLWLLNRAGGEAVKISDVKHGVSEYAWAPDGKHLVLVVSEPDPRDPEEDDKASADKKKTAPPIVIDRYHFKEDISGYLRNERTHLYLFDLAAKKTDMLTSGTFDEESPVWSPDSTRIAFVSKRGTGDLDRSDNTDIWVVDAKAGAQARQVTTSPASDNGPVSWSPDGQSIAYQVGDEPKFYAYSLSRLAVIPSAGGTPRILTESLDRPISGPAWSPDGRSLTFVVIDDRVERVARVPAAGGPVQDVLSGARVVTALGAELLPRASQPEDGA